MLGYKKAESKMAAMKTIKGLELSKRISEIQKVEGQKIVESLSKLEEVLRELRDLDAEDLADIATEDNRLNQLCQIQTLEITKLAHEQILSDMIKWKKTVLSAIGIQKTLEMNLEETKKILEAALLKESDESNN